MYDLAFLFSNDLINFLSLCPFTMANKLVAKSMYPLTCSASLLNCSMYSLRVSMEPYFTVRRFIVSFHWSCLPKNWVTKTPASSLKDPIDFLFSFLNHSLVGHTRVKNALHLMASRTPCSSIQDWNERLLDPSFRHKALLTQP